MVTMKARGGTQPPREGCIAQAVLGAVESFVDTSAVRPERSLRCQVAGHSDEDLLVAVLDEVVYLLDTANEVAVEVELDPTEAGADVRFGMCNATRLSQTGAVPKAVSLHELRITRGPRGWGVLGHARRVRRPLLRRIGRVAASLAPARPEPPRPAIGCRTNSGTFGSCASSPNAVR